MLREDKRIYDEMHTDKILELWVNWWFHIKLLMMSY